MRCAWQEFINLLPRWMRSEADRNGRDHGQELRLRLNQPPELLLHTGAKRFDRVVTEEDISFVVNTASQYSPWAAATISKGYITAEGGHRIGICGQAVMKNGILEGIRHPTSLCIRIARDFPGIAKNIPAITGSILIIGSPGSGKTTLLRDLIRCKAEKAFGSISVVDERGEIFPFRGSTSCFTLEQGIDVLHGAPKEEGIDMVLRTMGPVCIAIDEITAQEDTRALIRTAWSGVDLIATAHASSKQDLLSRPIYRSIVSIGLFDRLIVMNRDKSWHIERMSNEY